MGGNAEPLAVVAALAFLFANAKKRVVIKHCIATWKFLGFSKLYRGKF